MEKTGGAFRKKKVYFSQVSNHALRDKNLSLKAKGLYALIQSYITIEGFTLYKNMLRKQCPEGREAFGNTWKELKDKGYLIQYKSQNKETGKFVYEYDLLDKPIHVRVSRIVDNPSSGKPVPIDNTYPNNTDLNKTKKTYTALPSGAHIFLDIYKDQFKRYKEKEHMGVTKEQLVSIENAMDRLVQFGVTEEEFLEAVIDHFENLPADNNGNVIAFLYTCMRRFEVDVIYYCN